jgi:PDZ domain-containing protein
MRRRTWASLLAVVLVVLMSAVALSRPVPYSTFSPGPTVNVLGKSGDKYIITVSGHRYYRDKGGLRLLTVIPSGPEDKVNLPQLVTAWIDPDRAVYPYDSIYPKTATQKSVRQESTVEMVSSQDNAVAAALGALKIPYTSVIKVAGLTKGGPADGKLKAGDVVVAVNGTKINTLDGLTGAVRPLPVGSKLTMTVKRGDQQLEKKLTTTTSPQDKKSSAVLISIALGYEFPFDVKLNLDENIGGPSGGMMFALGIYDTLTPGSLTGGKTIAGTGEIDPQGKVGEIGGIQQKLVGAQNDGAHLFLVPAANCAEALDGHYDPKKMRLVKVNTLNEAIADVKAWVQNPDAQLTKCTK